MTEALLAISALSVVLLAFWAIAEIIEITSERRDRANYKDDWLVGWPPLPPAEPRPFDGPAAKGFKRDQVRRG